MVPQILAVAETLKLVLFHLKRLLHQLLRQDGLGREAMVYGFSDVGSRFISAISGVVIARLFAPADVGTFSTIVAISSIVALLSTWRYELAVPIPRTRERGSSAVVCALCGVVGTCTFLVVAVAATKPYGATGLISALLHDASAMDPGLLWWIPLLVLIYGTGLVAQAWLLRNNALTRFGAIRLMQAAITLVINAFSGMSSPSFLALIVAEAFGKASVVLAFAGRLRPSLARLAARIERKRHKGAGAIASRLAIVASTMRRYRSIALLTTPAVSIHQILELAPTVFLAFRFGAEPAAQWALMQFGLAVLGTPSQAVSAPFYRRFTQYYRQRQQDAAIFFVHALGLLLGLSLPGAIVMAVAAPEIYRIIFGPQWLRAGELLQVMALPACINYVGTTWPMMVVIGAQRTQFFVSLVAGLAAIFVCLMSLYLELSFFSTAILLRLCPTMLYAMMLRVCYQWSRTVRMTVPTSEASRRIGF